jgi:hypothetical protein
MRPVRAIEGDPRPGRAGITKPIVNRQRARLWIDLDDQHPRCIVRGDDDAGSHGVERQPVRRGVRRVESEPCCFARPRRVAQIVGRDGALGRRRLDPPVVVLSNWTNILPRSAAVP